MLSVPRNWEQNLRIFLSKKSYIRVLTAVFYRMNSFTRFVPLFCFLRKQLSIIIFEALGKKNLEFYDSVVSSPAFSFYYLSVRKGGTDIPKDIGEAFAMLCRKESDPFFIGEGSKIYSMVLDFVEAEISDAHFVN